MLNHIVNIHEGHSDTYPQCDHGELEERAWLKKGRFTTHLNKNSITYNSMFHKYKFIHYMQCNRHQLPLLHIITTEHLIHI